MDTPYCRWTTPVRRLSAVLILVAPLIVRGAAPVPPAPDLAAAIALFDANRLGEARPLFEERLAIAPDDPEANYYRGEIAASDGDWRQAVACAERAVAHDPKNARYQNGLGDACGVAAQSAGMFARLGFAHRCRAAYERAVALDPQDTGYRTDLMTFYQQAPAFAGGGLDKAFGQAREIKRLDPVRGHEAFAALYITEKKYDLAFGELEQALRLDPNDYRSLYQIGRLSAQSGQNLDRGTAALCRCLALNPSMRPENPPRWFVLWRLGNICEKQGDLAGARARYRAALQAHADFPQVRDALRRIGG